MTVQRFINRGIAGALVWFVAHGIRFATQNRCETHKLVSRTEGEWGGPCRYRRVGVPVSGGGGT